MISPEAPLNVPVARQYGRLSLDIGDLDSNPFSQFNRWFAESSPTAPEPAAMALATSDKSGRPSVRMVLLKGADANGFLFGTNYESRKGKEAEGNGQAALLFYWPAMERQVRVVGRIERASAKESDDIFMARPLGSRLAARISHQSDVAESRKQLEDMLRQEAETVGEEQATRPSYWGAYRVIPNEFEFWQGGRDRLHDRFVYLRTPEGWNIQRLMP